MATRTGLVCQMPAGSIFLSTPSKRYNCRALAISGLTRNSPKLDGHRSGLTSWGLGSKVLWMVDKTGDSVSLVIGEIESEIFRVLSIQPRI